MVVEEIEKSILNIYSLSERQEKLINSYSLNTQSAYRVYRKCCMDDVLKDAGTHPFEYLPEGDIIRSKKGGYCVDRLIVSSSFLSAWYAINGEHKKRKEIIELTLNVLTSLYANRNYFSSMHELLEFNALEFIPQYRMNLIRPVVILFIVGYVLYLVFTT